MRLRGIDFLELIQSSTSLSGTVPEKVLGFPNFNDGWGDIAPRKQPWANFSSVQARKLVPNNMNPDPSDHTFINTNDVTHPTNVFNLITAPYFRTPNIANKYTFNHATLYQNPEQENKFWQLFRCLGDNAGNVRIVFHGTNNSDALESIITSGFKIGGKDGHGITNAQFHGEGVYTSNTAATALQYADNDSRSQPKLTIIVCLLIPGVKEGLTTASQRDGNCSVHKCDGSGSSSPQCDWLVVTHERLLLPFATIEVNKV
jgi:hypothetical protein